MDSDPHFVLFPLMAQGHMIPMVDIAKLLASRGVTVTIITTPLNSARFKPSLSGYSRIELVELRLPCIEAGLPEGCENVDMLPSFDYLPCLYKAAAMMESQVELLFENMKVKPTCIVSDAWLPYTSNLANKFRVPRISFHGTSCFSLLCIHCVKIDMEEVDRRAGAGNGGFVVPGMPGRIEFTRVQLPVRVRMAEQANPRNEFGEQMTKAELEAYGVIVNSFEELEPEYCLEYKKSKQGKVWCIGPVSLINRDELEKLQRGNNNHTTLSAHRSLDWLNTKEPNSVVYACLGSICNLSTQQLIELALGLEASKVPFIWAIRETVTTNDLYRWIVDEGFEERVVGRGMVTRGWAPQVSILSHRSIGGFLTHCGWNSCLEGISSGVPLVTWPLFGDQFSNEKLIVEVAKVGVRVGAERPTFWDGKEQTNVSVKRGDVERAVRSIMEGGEEEGNRRKRAIELGEMARKAAESGGSSYRNIAMFVEDIVKTSTG